ncbi:uncharacterized protein WM277_011579 [Molossus nigricans]
MTSQHGAGRCCSRPVGASSIPPEDGLQNEDGYGVNNKELGTTYWTDTRGTGGRGRSNSQPPHPICFRSWCPASQQPEAGTHPPGFMNPPSCLLQTERKWLGQTIHLKASEPFVGSCHQSSHHPLQDIRGDLVL